MSCTDCERCSFDDACAARDKVAPIPSKLDDWMHANGWEWPRSPFNGYVRLCAKCTPPDPTPRRGLRPMTTLADALDVIEQAKACRPTCDQDETQPFYASLREPDGPEGFELDPNFAGYRKRCPACASGKLFPWADKLDPERVRAFMETDPRCKGAFALDILKETLPTYYYASIDRTLEAMFAYELAGSEEGARELLRSIDLSEPGVACRTCGALDCTKNHAEFV